MKSSAPALLDLGSARSLLFVRLGKLGDLLVCSGLFARARKRYPRLRLGLLTLPRSLPLFSHNRDLDLLLAWRPWALPALVLRERLRGWDLLVDLNDSASTRSVLVQGLLGARSSVAFRNARSERTFDLTVPAAASDSSHVLQRLESMAAALGLHERQPLRPAMSLNPISLARARRQRSACGSKARVVSLNLSAGHASRYWAPEKWRALALALVKASPRVRLRLLAAPQDGALAAELAAALPAQRLLPGPGPSLHDFLAAIACSELLVSPDTSAVHAAGAARVPVLGLYPEPAWNLTSWGPQGPQDIALRSSQGGVDGIALEPVRRAALKLLKAIL